MCFIRKTIPVKVMYIGKNFILYTFSEIIKFLLHAECAQKMLPACFSMHKKGVAHAQCITKFEILKIF
jgi:hypothetical protein